MNWLSGLSPSERDEMFLDCSEAFNSEQITEKEYRDQLAKLGFNATDIEECVKQHRPFVEDGNG